MGIGFFGLFAIRRTLCFGFFVIPDFVSGYVRATFMARCVTRVATGICFCSMLFRIVFPCSSMMLLIGIGIGLVREEQVWVPHCPGAKTG